MKYVLKAYNIWELGQREKQEDSIFPEFGKIQDSDRLFILCDGMGGHSAGEVASQTVCESMSEYIFAHCPDAEGFFDDEDFKAALSAAYDALDTKDNGDVRKMGTTLTFLKFHSEGCTIAHIGDSRVYQIRPGKESADTKIIFQTVDHSLVNDLIKIGEMTPEEAKHSNQKNVITRAMQPGKDRRPKADIYHTNDILPGDYFMLCSDGILEQMEDENLQYIFSEKVADDKAKMELLTRVTIDNRDNHSAIVVHILEVSKEQTKNIEVEDSLVSVPEPKPVPESNPVIQRTEELVDRVVDSFLTNKKVKKSSNRIFSKRNLLIGTIMLLLLLLLLCFFLLSFAAKKPKEESTYNSPISTTNVSAGRPQQHAQQSPLQLQSSQQAMQQDTHNIETPSQANSLPASIGAAVENASSQGFNSQTYNDEDAADVVESDEQSQQNTVDGATRILRRNKEWK